jgi:predicted protein tyrosine phosphatase
VRVEVVDRLLVALLTRSPSVAFGALQALQPTPDEAAAAQRLVRLDRDIEQRLHANERTEPPPGS